MPAPEDALSPSGRIARSVLIAAVLVGAYGVSVKQTEIDLPGLVEGLPEAMPLVRSFATPDLFAREEEVTTRSIGFPVPCGSGDRGALPSQGPRITTAAPCAEVGEYVEIEGLELPPNSRVRLRWLLAGAPDEKLRITTVEADADGYFRTEVEVRPIVAAQGGDVSQLQAEIRHPVGAPKPSPALLETIDAAILTLFMALIATSFAAVVAAPTSFLAAANISRKGVIGTLVYTITRGYFNVTRTFEPLVLATVFGLWVGFGAFAGVLALTVFTIGSLGKLYAEAVESIDPGLIEAISATGASRLEVIRYGVVPQILPEFASLSVYHWDINVRISTIIGFVGGGGIGFLLNEQIKTFAYSKAATAIWAIVAMVWLLDFFSADVRRRLT